MDQMRGAPLSVSLPHLMNGTTANSRRDPLDGLRHRHRTAFSRRQQGGLKGHPTAFTVAMTTQNRRQVFDLD
jgi:hypothetical protein